MNTFASPETGHLTAPSPLELALTDQGVAQLLARIPQDLELQHAPDLSRISPDTPTAFQPSLDALRKELLSGSGVVLMRIHQSDRMTNRQLTALHVSIGTLLGRLRWQNRSHDVVITVQDTRPACQERARGFTSNSHMKAHTDGWDAVGLVCLSSAARGGCSFFVSTDVVFRAVQQEAPDLAHLLFEPWIWDIRVLTGNPLAQPVRSPIFYRDGPMLRCRFGSSMLRNGPDAEGKILSQDRLRLIELIEDVSGRESFQWRHDLLRGEIVWVRNDLILHGREKFEDGEYLEKRRHLMRLWITITNGDARRADFEQFDRIIFGEDS